jgi:haloalkane dehalogenase
MGLAISPDLMGMGKSDKPDIEYRVVDLVKCIEESIEVLEFKDTTFVIRNWSSSLGFHYAMRHESNMKGLAFMEAILVEHVLPGSVMRKLADEEMERYKEPFREQSARLPMWRWPRRTESVAAYGAAQAAVPRHVRGHR